MKNESIKINTLKIKALRVENNLTQENIAELLGIAPNTYHRKEKGLTEFTLSEAKKISIVFNRGMDEIFFGQKVTDCITNNKSA